MPVLSAIEREVQRIHEMRRRLREIADADAAEGRPGWRSDWARGIQTPAMRANARVDGRPAS